MARGDESDVELSQSDFESLAAFRRELRRYLSFAQEAAEKQGVTMQQHQALLAIRAAPGQAMAISSLAETLFLRHHSAVELTNRLAAAGLVHRSKSEGDARLVMLMLTSKGSQILTALSALHLMEIHELGPSLARNLRRVIRQTRESSGNRR